jgi:hypothetical protein
MVRNANDIAFEMKYEHHTYQESLPTFPALKKHAEEPLLRAASKQEGEV